MERPGEKLKHVRERLKLTYRDVEKASQQLAQRRASDEFAIALSRLADIENKGTVPTIFRLYSLCAIYRLNLGRGFGLVRGPGRTAGGGVAANPLSTEPTPPDSLPPGNSPCRNPPTLKSI